MNKLIRRVAWVWLVLSVTGISVADEIKVMPGESTISMAAANAKAGDVIVLAEGEYRDEVRLPAGVSVRGAGADKTILVGSGYAVINALGPDCRVEHLEIRGSDQATRGVNANSSVYVARCRFRDVKEAVALMEAPLSDVVLCEFVNCGIGVRAIAESSPTVWGCIFRECRMGIFAMEGAPYIQNNVFIGSDIGARLILGGEPAIVRNNVFKDCKTTAIDARPGKKGDTPPSVRNNVFMGGGAAMLSPSPSARGVSHCAISGVTPPAFHDEGGIATIEQQDAKIIELDPKFSIDDHGLVTLGAAADLAGKGMRTCREKPDAVGNIGLTAEDNQVGPLAKVNTPAPAPRFASEPFVANAVSEEWQWMGLNQARMSRQSLQTKDGKNEDALEVTIGGKQRTVRFNIDRFFGEAGLRP